MRDILKIKKVALKESSGCINRWLISCGDAHAARSAGPYQRRICFMLGEIWCPDLPNCKWWEQILRYKVIIMQTNMISSICICIQAKTRAHTDMYIYIHVCIIYIVYAPGKDNPWLWPFRCYFYHKHLWPQNFQLSTAQPLTFPAGGRIEWDWMSVPRAGTLTINSLGHAWPLGPGISEMFSHDSCEHPAAWFLELIEPRTNSWLGFSRAPFL